MSAAFVAAGMGRQKSIQAGAVHSRRVANLTALATSFLYQLVSKRYTKGSIIVTSNKSYAEWGSVFGGLFVLMGLVGVGMLAGAFLLILQPARQHERGRSRTGSAAHEVAEHIWLGRSSRHCLDEGRDRVSPKRGLGSRDEVQKLSNLPFSAHQI